MAFSIRSAISSLKPILFARVSSPKPLSVKVVTNHFSTSNEDPHKSVFISQSSDVFSNLALEDWLYKNFDFKNHHVMLLWRNDPCVVIGRHQNPWMEANIEALADRGITLARRNSGGGTVYHDKGNLNITFFTPRELYNRKKNLQLIEKTIEREWNLDIEINKREDLILDSKYKVSGTAAKLGRPTAYHHCTLMVHVNKDDLALSLKKSNAEKFTTKALESIGSSIQNLGDAHNEVQMERLMERLGWEFMRTNVNLADEGWLHVSKQNGFQMINPTDEWFPGLSEIRDEFASWDWKFGKTPAFTVERPIEVEGVDSNKMPSLKISVEKGIVTSDIALVVPDGVSWGGVSGVIPLHTTIVGQKYSQNLFKILEKAVYKQGLSFESVRSSAESSASARTA